MGYRLITPATVFPVTTEQAKQHCRIDDDGDDDYIDALIAAATAQAETLTGRCIAAQTWELLSDSFPECDIEIDKGPVQSITSITYYDTAGDIQTLSAASYALDATAEPALVILNDGYDWPEVEVGTNKMIVRFVAGYSSVPPTIYHACLLLIGQWYDQRSGTSDKPITETPNAVKSLLFPQQAMVI